ncbi:MAG: aminotransferase class IV [Limisphaerales bacterium]
MMAHYIQANTDGRLHSATEPSISPLNRGFLYGDAIYEVWRTYQGTIFGFEEHWIRLEQSAKALYLELPLNRTTLLEQIQRTTKAFFEVHQQPTELYIRLQITRGAGAIGLDTGLADKSSYVILVQPLKENREKWHRTGMRLSVANTMHRMHTETVNPAWKTGNYLNNILCLREAQSRGADEVLMTNLAGEITEAAVSNLFFVRGNTLVTPPLSVGILAGITRRLVIDQAAPAAGLQVREDAISLKHLGEFEECFITSTTKELASVSAIDEVHFKVGEGTETAKLRKAFAEIVNRYIASHPELKIPGTI